MSVVSLGAVSTLTALSCGFIGILATIAVATHKTDADTLSPTVCISQKVS